MDSFFMKVYYKPGSICWISVHLNVTEFIWVQSTEIVAPVQFMTSETHEG